MKRWWTKIAKLLLAAVDWCVPERLQASSEDEFRARVFAGMCWCASSSLFVGILVRFVIVRVWTPLASVVLSVGLLFLALPFLMRWSSSPRALGFWSTWLVSLLTCTLSFVGIGIEGPVLSILPVLVLIHVFFVGVRSGLILAVVLNVLVFLMLWVQWRGGLPHWIQTPERVLWGMRAVALTMASCLVVALAMVFEWSRLRSEKQLQETTERYEVAIQATNDGIFDWDVLAGVVHLAPRFAILLGYEPGALCLETPFDDVLVPHEERDKVRRLRDLLLGGAAQFDLELRLVKSDGAVCWFQMSGAAILSDDALVRVIGSIRDISLRKQVDDIKGEFVSNVSHELRTPLTSIVGSLSLLRGLQEVQPAQRDLLLELADKNAQRLLRLVNDLLDFQRIAQGQERFSFEPVNVMDFVKESLALHQVLAAQYGVALCVEEADLSVVFAVDVARMHQVMGNLLSNALKVSPEESRITLKIVCAESHVKISISDQGPGIPDHLRGRLFERFTRDSSLDKRNSGGTGLGLAIARALVRGHQGELTYQTVQGKGTTFVISVPCLLSEDRA